MGFAAVVLPVGPDHYAVAASSVREIVADTRATALPTGPTVTIGAFNLRGEVVPLFDTSVLLGIGRLGTASVAVVVDTPAGPVGLAASGMPRVTMLGDAVGSSDLKGTSTVHPLDDGVAVLVDVEALLQPHTSWGALLDLTTAR